MSLKILQFGATGQLAREMIAAAPAFDLTLTALSRAQADVADAAAIRRAIAASDADLVVNATAYSAVDRAEDEAATAFAVNGAGPGVMAEACAARGLPLVHVSTDSVFAGDKIGAYVETDPAAPLSVYGASKREGEAGVLAANDRATVIRTSWLFSARGRNFLQIMLGQRAAPSLQVVADQRARPTASGDLARFILATAPRWVAAPANDDAFGLVHFANAGVATRLEMARAIFELVGAHPTLIPVDSAAFGAKAHRPPNAELDTARLARVFGVTPRPWREALAEVMAEMRETAS